MPELRKWFRMLRVRFVLWTVMLEAFLLIVFAILLVAILQNNQNQQIYETLRLSAAQMNAVVDLRGDTFDIPTQDVADLQSRGVFAWILNSKGGLGATVGRASQLALPNPIPELDTAKDIVLQNGETVRLFVSELNESNQFLGTLILGLPLKTEFMLIQQVQLSLLISIPFVLILSGLGGLFLANRALSPVKAISATARQISATDLSQRIELDLPDDEIGQLAHTFNEMLERIDEAFRHERQFTSDASHELRTPLGFLKTQLSLARSKSRTASELLEMMKDMENDVDRMTRLIEQMLMLARTENFEVPQKQEINLAELITDLSAEYLIRAQEQNKILILDMPSGIDFQLQGIPQLIHQVLVNLLENALKYTDTGDTIHIQLRKQWQDIAISIEDTGQGISPEHIPHLFDRFYRVDSARTRDSGGFGLGLAITKAIVQAHGGNIQVRSEMQKGTTFIIHFTAETG